MSVNGTGGERRLRRDAAANREKVLQAAAALFARHGLGVGHDQIAHAAGVAVGTVYRRFPDKATLVAALYADQVERAVTAAEAALLVEDPWEAIVEFMTAILQTQAGSRGLRELSTGNPHGQQLAELARRRVAPVVAELVARGHAAGVLRPEVVEADLALVPIMVGAIINAAGDADPGLWHRSLAIVLAGMRVGDSTPLPEPAPDGEQVRRMLTGPAGEGSS